MQVVPYSIQCESNTLVDILAELSTTYTLTEGIEHDESTIDLTIGKHNYHYIVDLNGESPILFLDHHFMGDSQCLCYSCALNDKNDLALSDFR